MKPTKTIEKFDQTVGAMHKRRETMADERRYILYYTFGETAQTALTKAVKSKTKKENS